VRFKEYRCISGHRILLKLLTRIEIIECSLVSVYTLLDNIVAPLAHRIPGSCIDQLVVTATYHIEDYTVRLGST
jgi:hypothetical protein